MMFLEGKGVIYTLNCNVVIYMLITYKMNWHEFMAKNSYSSTLSIK